MVAPLVADVAIIGGGPGGLAAAHAICRAAPKLKVSVFERAPALSRRGAGLGIDINGQKALRAIDPELHKRVVALGAILERSRQLRPDGSVVTDSAITSPVRAELARQGIQTPCLLGWSELQQELADSLPPQATLTMGAEFSHYEEDPAASTITIHFRQSTSSSGAETNNPQPQSLPPVTASLLVAADGYFSRVRRQCVGDGPPSYRNTILWRARLPAQAAMDAGCAVAPGESLMVRGEGRFLMAYPISSGDIVWTVGVQDEQLRQHGLAVEGVAARLRSLDTSDADQQASATTGGAVHTGDQQQHQQQQGVTPDGSEADSAAAGQGFSQQDRARGEAARQRCLQVLGGFAPPVLALISASDAAAIVEHGVFVRPWQAIGPHWFGEGRVVLLGDAAHPVRPTGQGLNTTLEDAYQLGVAMLGVANCDNVETLAPFRQHRAARLGPIIKFTTLSGEAAYKNSSSSSGGASLEPADAPGMTAQQFSEMLYSVDFADLQQLLHQQQQHDDQQR